MNDTILRAYNRLVKLSDNNVMYTDTLVDVYLTSVVNDLKNVGPLGACDKILVTCMRDYLNIIEYNYRNNYHTYNLVRIRNLLNNFL